MITSGNNLDSIIEKISILKHEIDKRAMLGFTNLNKLCENFILHLLNLVYDYKLENLNASTSNFPGLDLGDKINKIAYQVTSEKTSEKIDDTLSKCLNHAHYKIFSAINVFIISKKQSSYSIKTITEPYFIFDSKKNIIDFDDVLKDIGNLSPERIKKVHDFISEELAYTISTIQEKEIKSTKPSSLIDIDSSINKVGLKYFYHWCCRIEHQGMMISVPKMYNELFEFYKVQDNRIIFLPILYKPWEKSTNSKRVLFHQTVQKHANISNRASENAFEISQSSIVQEFAEYTDTKEMLTTLNHGFNELFSLLLFFKKLTKTNEFLLKVDVNINSNGKLFYTPQNSTLSIKSTFSNHELDDGGLEYSIILKDLKNETLFELMQSLLNGFVIKERSHLFGNPFLEIDEGNSQLVINNINGRFGMNHHN